MLNNNPPHILIGTPGRIMGLVRDRELNLKNIKFFILDEWDKMLSNIGIVKIDMRNDVQKIFFKTPKNKQVMMFSATICKDIRPIWKKFMKTNVSLTLSLNKLRLMMKIN